MPVSTAVRIRGGVRTVGHGESTSLPPAAVPILTVTLPAVPDPVLLELDRALVARVGEGADDHVALAATRPRCCADRRRRRRRSSCRPASCRSSRPDRSRTRSTCRCRPCSDPWWHPLRRPAAESISLPPAAVPILTVTLPAVPTQCFFSSIEPWLRVLVKVQTITEPAVTATESSVPTETGVAGSSLLSTQSRRRAVRARIGLGRRSRCRCRPSSRPVVASAPSASGRVDLAAAGRGADLDRHVAGGARPSASSARSSPDSRVLVKVQTITEPVLTSTASSAPTATGVAGSALLSTQSSARAVRARIGLGDVVRAGVDRVRIRGGVRSVRPAPSRPR